MDIRIIRLTAEWAQPYRDLRLEALKKHPDIYASSYEEESRMSVQQFAERLEHAWIAGLICDTLLVGIAALAPARHARMRHKGIISAVYIRSDYQGQKLGRKLMEAMLAEAQARFEQVQVNVVAHNPPAIALYESLGFERYGYEKRAAKLGDAYFDDILMVKFLKFPLPLAGEG